MALSQSSFRSKNGAKRTFLPSGKLPNVNRANEGVVSNFRRMTSSDAVFTIIFGTKKINNTFYRTRRNNPCNSQSEFFVLTTLHCCSPRAPKLPPHRSICKNAAFHAVNSLPRRGPRHAGAPQRHTYPKVAPHGPVSPQRARQPATVGMSVVAHNPLILWCV